MSELPSTPEYNMPLCEVLEEQLQLLEQREEPPTLTEIYTTAKLFVDAYSAPSDPTATDSWKPDKRTPPIPHNGGLTECMVRRSDYVVPTYSFW